MRKSKVLAKLRAGKPARIAALGHFLPYFIRYAARYGYDGIWFDLEHRAFDDREVQTILHLCYYNDIDCMVRPPTTERTKLYRYLEEGASGFMMPFVSTPAYARQIVEYTKFPPMGNRGVDGAGLDAGYGQYTWIPDSTYYEDANRETFIVAQIETAEAVENVDAIAAVPGIDMLFIGPADMGLRMSVRTDGPRLSMEEVMQRVSDAAKKHGKTWGRTAGTVEDLERFTKMGAQMIPWGSEFGAIMNALSNGSKELDRIFGDK